MDLGHVDLEPGEDSPFDRLRASEYGGSLRLGMPDPAADATAAAGSWCRSRSRSAGASVSSVAVPQESRTGPPSVPVIEMRLARTAPKN